MQESEPISPRAIIVDDEPAIREYVGMVARQAGFDISLAGSGDEFLGLLGEPFPALIVLDLNMANTDGVQVMRELAARQVTSKIVIFSGSDYRILEASGNIARQHGLTISAVVQKPIRKNELLQLLRKLGLESEVFSATTLRACLDEKLIALHYQPKIALPSRAVIGCEALLRCSDSLGRAVPAEKAISVAESAGMIDELTEWVFREALTQRESWSRAGFDLSIAVNLSAHSSFNQDFPELLVRLCAERHVPTTAVTIELTESAVMDDRLLAMETMVRLRLKGFQLSIDDFGTGYSSLLRLKQLPFTEMKVDKSFIIALHESRDNAVIVKAIIQLARNLEMRCVAEGVEDRKALEFVVGHGCDEAQGYHIARPMPAAEFPGFIKTWQWRQDPTRQMPDPTIAPGGDPSRERRT
jgi:EAL domain-containing protein (putative c-di-GMP-specific phosphodiesterase class I)/CheY-like chemotaxis protein